VKYLGYARGVIYKLVRKERSLGRQFFVIRGEKTMKKENTRSNIRSSGPAGTIYGLDLIGAAIYYISHATGFGMGVIGFLKAIVWPAFLVYELLGFLGM